jgi:hypothetical protein
MASIYQIGLGKKNLEAIPVEERRLLLLLGHATNEINVLQKLIIESGQVSPEHKFVDHVQAGQTLILMRILIGKLHEAWELFKVRFQGKREIRDLYFPKLDDKAQDALTQLKKHFGKQSPLTLIRNRLSFHYKDDHDLVETSFQRIPEDEGWNFYLSDVQANCFYYASELVIGNGMTDHTQAAGDTGSYLEREARAFGYLCDLVINISRQIMTLFGECIACIVTERISGVEAPVPVKINSVKLGDIAIPFFIDEDEFTPASKKTVQK